MANLTIRPATPADHAAVDAVLKASYPVLLAPDYAPEALAAVLPLMAAVQPALLCCGTYYVAERGGLIVGAGGWTSAAPGSGAVVPGLGHVRHVAVDHRQTRCGIARALLDYSFDAAREAGLKRLECLSTLSAVPFYKAVGFAPVEQQTAMVGGRVPFDAVRMMRDL